MLLLLGLLSAHVVGLTAQDTIDPETMTVSGTVGEAATLTCNYKTTAKTVDLHWYRHQSDLQAPQFLLWKRGRGGTAEYIPDKKRYQSQTSESSTSLTIKVLTLADSALYYCALEHGDTKLNHCAWRFTFGKPITLTVLPKESTLLDPSLFILSPQQLPTTDHHGYPPQTTNKLGPNACLATNFRPREGQMVLNVGGDESVTMGTMKAALYKRKSTYVFVGFSNKEIHSCKLHGASSDKNVTDENVTICPLENETHALNYDSFPSFYPEKASMNFFGLLLNGIRVIFTKALAFSTALTIRAVL
ncbi:immunoglobulin kappa light chain-like [Pholidichthys leucotaenia]